MKLLLFTFIILSMPAWAYHKSTPQECSPITLERKLNSDTRNQGEVAWCYAFTSADLIGAVYKLPVPVSAADVALRYNKTFPAKIVQFFRRLTGAHKDNPIERYLPHQTGFSKVAIERVYKDGWCPESVFPSEKWVKKTRVHNGWKTSEVSLDVAFAELLALSANRDNLTVKTIPYFYTFKNIETPNLFFDLLKKYKYNEFLQQLRLTACKNDRYQLTETYPVKMIIKYSRVFDLLNKQLDQGRLVGLDYDSRVLKKFKNYGFSLDNLHSSVLLGRQWNQDLNECEYLVRDSYGKECKDYDPGTRCHNGYVWLPESIVYKNMTSIVYQASK